MSKEDVAVWILDDETDEVIDDDSYTNWEEE